MAPFGRRKGFWFGGLRAYDTASLLAFYGLHKRLSILVNGALLLGSNPRLPYRGGGGKNVET